jgi:hypothetical protein
MTVDAWLRSALADAERRGLPELKPLLESLARATIALRHADFNDDAAEAGSMGDRAAHINAVDTVDGRPRSNDWPHS